MASQKEESFPLNSRQPPRNVYGSDIIVSYNDKKDQVLVCMVTPEMGSLGRLSLGDIESLLGFRSRTGKHFIKNNNLHDPKKGMRGALVMIDYRIGLVVRCTGSFILLQVLLPKKESGRVLLLDLRNSEGHHGFFLQQIHGELVGRITNLCRKRTCPYPYIVNDTVYMDPAGPHFFIPKTLSSIPKNLSMKFKSIQDNLCTRNMAPVSSYACNRRNSKMSNILYIVDTGSRCRLGRMTNKFFVPLGKPYDSVASPWVKTDKTCETE